VLTDWALPSRFMLTLTVRAAGRGLVGAGGVLGLCPCGSRYALAAWALPSRFALRAHRSRSLASGFALRAHNN
jgi:hypothetical protein